MSGGVSLGRGEYGLSTESVYLGVVCGVLLSIEIVS